MEIIARQEGKYTTLDISGRLDAGTAPDLEDALAQHGAQPGAVLLLDCSGMEFISSAGLRVLLASAKGMHKRGGSILLCCLQDNVQQVFDIAGFSSIFHLYRTREDALNDLRG